MSSTAIFASGFGIAFGLIVAIGAQSAFVLRQAIMRNHIVPVVLVCAFSDMLFMSIGIAGFGSIVENAPWLITGMRLFGGAFLVYYGFLALRRAMKPSAMATETGPARKSLLPVLGATLAVTYLNPHFYLDTVVLLGSIANSHGDAKWIFGFGAMLASIVWFTLLGFGARFLQPLFEKPRSWQFLDGVIAIIMFTIAVNVLSPLV